MNLSSETALILAKFHRSSISHFERLESVHDPDKNLQILAEYICKRNYVFSQLQHLIQVQSRIRKFRHRQRHVRFKRKSELEMLNQVARKLYHVECKQSDRRKRTNLRASQISQVALHHVESTASMDAEQAYLGDVSYVSSLETIGVKESSDSSMHSVKVVWL